MYMFNVLDVCAVIIFVPNDCSDINDIHPKDLGVISGDHTTSNMMYQ